MSTPTQSAMPALLTHAECLVVLMNYAGQNDLKLENYALQPITDAGGYLGEYYQLTLTVVAKNVAGSGADKREDLPFFVKTLPTHNSEVAIKYIFQKEAHLLTSLITDLQSLSRVKWSPHCYYARDDLIVLQDLKLLDYQLNRKYLEPEVSMKQLLRSLAAMHAASLAYEHKRKVNIGSRYGEWLGEITLSPKVAWCTTGMNAIAAVIAAHPDYQQPAVQSFIRAELNKHMAQVYAMVESSTRYCNVLCQRDAWAANVFLPRTGQPADPAIIVDYQTSRYSPPSIELLLALYMNLPPAVRKQHESTYLRWYYAHFERDLQAQGMDAGQYMTLEQLLASYEEFRLFGCVYNAIACTLIRVPLEFVTNEYKHVDRTPQVLQHMRKNQEFRQLMSDCVHEIMDIILPKQLTVNSAV